MVSKLKSPVINANTIREQAIAKAEKGLTPKQKQVARDASAAAYKDFTSQGAPWAHIFEFDSFGATAANAKVTPAIEARLYDMLRDNGFAPKNGDELVSVTRGVSYAEGKSFAQFLAVP